MTIAFILVFLAGMAVGATALTVIAIVMIDSDG